MQINNNTVADRRAKSIEMKKLNARQAGFNEIEAAVYLSGRVSLGRARAFVKQGNQGKGFKLLLSSAPKKALRPSHGAS